MKNVICALVVCLMLALAAACSPPSSTVNTNSTTTNTVANTSSITDNTNTATVTTNTASTTAATTPTTTTASTDSAASRALYAQHCAMCHGAGGEGQSAGAIPSLKTGHATAHSEAELINYITNGHGAMPAFKSKLSAEQIASMVKYIRQDLQGKK